MSLRPPTHRVERGAICWWMLQPLLLAVPVMAAAIIAYVWWESARPWLLLAVIAASLLLIVGVVVEPLLRYRVHSWETTVYLQHVQYLGLHRELESGIGPGAQPRRHYAPDTKEPVHHP